MRRSFLHLRKILSSYTWDIGYGDFSESVLQNGLNRNNLHFVKNPYKDKWFADPFILKDEERRLDLLVEEFDNTIKKGRIAHLVIDKISETIVDCQIILELPTHLSFPAIYRSGDVVYVHPENSESGASIIYRYNYNLHKLEAPVELIKKPLVDAVIRRVEDANEAYIMYATIKNNSCGKELSLFKSNQLIGEYKQIGVIEYNDKTARMAGAFVSTSRGVLRPAQDCRYDYGEAVFFYDDDKKVVYKLVAPVNCKYEGIHTFNSLGNTFVVDLKKYKYPVIHFCFKKLKQMISG